MPVEILLEIYQYLDLESIFRLARTNHSFLNFFKRRKASVLLPAIEREFTPFDELLQVYTASAEDLYSDGGLYKPRKIVFKRFAGDSGRVLAPHIDVSLTPLQSTSNDLDYVKIFKGRKIPSTSAAGLKTVVLTERDLDPLLELCRLVRQWEGLFPQMRWFYEPENCRSLRVHEAIRFRRAFYRWWLYGIYFHGELPRPRVGLPEPYVDDVRISQMRHYSTSELLELMDVMETMKDVILHYICPRLDPSQQYVSRIDRHLGSFHSNASQTGR
jgi:hypothetical protein